MGCTAALCTCLPVISPLGTSSLTKTCLSAPTSLSSSCFPSTTLQQPPSPILQQLTHINNLLPSLSSIPPNTHTHPRIQTHPTMIPKAREFSRSTGVIVGVAGTASAAPLLFFLPGAEERLAAQAAKWGPRWERGFSRVSPAVQRVNTRVEPKMKKGVQVVEPPLKGAAL